MLAIIRCIAIFIYFVLVNLGIILVCLIRPFHRNNLYLAGQGYAVISKLLGLTLKVQAPANIRDAGPCVYIANHQNSFDLVTVCAAAQPGTVCVGKKSLIWIPLLGVVYWLSGNMFIDRKNPQKAKQSLQKLVEKMRKRRLSVWFFPEGTRSNGRGLLPFKKGAFHIAQQADIPIIMVSVSNLHKKIKLNRWSNGTLLIDISQPIRLDETRSLDENIDYFQQQMSDTIQALNTHDNSPYPWLIDGVVQPNKGYKWAHR